MTGPQETEPVTSLRGEHLIPEEPIISDLGAEALGPYNPPITDLSVPIIVQVEPYERQVVSQAAMKANAATSSGDSHIPSMTVTTGGVPPPNQPSSVRATMVSTASTSRNGPILSIVAITAPFTQSVTGPPFSYGMPGFGTSTVLSYSTLQTLGLGVGSSNAPLQGSMGGTSSPYNSFPYRGGHIPPSSPSLGGAHQHSPGQTQTIVCLEQVVKNFLLITCRLVRHCSLCSVHLVTTLSCQLSSRPGATPVMDNKILYRVLFLHRGKT
jgi:hypothetical protein